MPSISPSLFLQLTSSSVICAAIIDHCFNCSIVKENNRHSVFVSEKLTSYNKLRRGDVVVVKAPNNPKHKTLNRIIGLEGDVTSNKMKLVDLNNVSEIIRFTNARVVTRGQVLLESADGEDDPKQFGPIPLGLVLSRVWGKIYPLSEATLYLRGEHDSL